jgi:predicted helicase
MTVGESPSTKHTFECIEAKIRRDAEGTAFGGDFEWLCKWFLEHAPRFRGVQFKKIWLWNDWPDRWGPDTGIDIVALDRAGDLWAIQSKADAPDRYVTKREIDSFLSESNRPEFAYRLLIATTDNIGAKARRVLDGQQKPVGLILRGDLISEQLAWPTEIGKAVKPLPRWKPRPHQATAIRRVVNGFKKHDRGRLIMACGTGKTLTALWIAERLKSRRSLILVPSLSLVGQNLAEWGRHGTGDFDALVVCSDPTVTERKSDAAFQSVADLGVKVTTNPAEIRQFLTKRHRRPAVVFSTYQSSDRVAAAQGKGSRYFDLGMAEK